MDSQCLRTFEFEVEVWYRDVDGVPKATKADCHTVCPQFVAAWVEQAAMKQFNSDQQADRLNKRITQIGIAAMQDDARYLSEKLRGGI